MVSVRNVLNADTTAFADMHEPAPREGRRVRGSVIIVGFGRGEAVI